jgi:NADH dehydrogenase FAD-containing subunit
MTRRIVVIGAGAASLTAARQYVSALLRRFRGELRGGVAVQAIERRADGVYVRAAAQALLSRQEGDEPAGAGVKGAPF